MFNNFLNLPVLDLISKDMFDGKIDGKFNDKKTGQQKSVFDAIMNLDKLDNGNVDGSIFNNELLQFYMDLLDDGEQNNSFQNYINYLDNPFEGAKKYDSRERYNVFGNNRVSGYNSQTVYNPAQHSSQAYRNPSIDPNSLVGNDVGTNAAKIALSQVGINEASGMHTKYGGNSHDAWCAHFVSWTYEQANGGKAPWGHQAGVSGILDWGKRNNRFIPKEQAQGKLKPGDVIIYKDNGASHTGIVTKVNSDGSVSTVEGNTKDAVRERTVKLNNKKLTGFVSV